MPTAYETRKPRRGYDAKALILQAFSRNHTIDTCLVDKIGKRRTARPAPCSIKTLLEFRLHQVYQYGRQCLLSAELSLARRNALVLRS